MVHEKRVLNKEHQLLIHLLGDFRIKMQSCYEIVERQTGSFVPELKIKMQGCYKIYRELSDLADKIVVMYMNSKRKEDEGGAI